MADVKPNLSDDENISAIMASLGETASSVIDAHVHAAVMGPMFYDDLPWYRDLKACTACACRTEAKQVVSGAGALSAEIMVLGRNPGKDEDKNGFPFMGKGGQELDIWFDKLGLDRGKLLVTNLVKCHTTKDRAPKPPEIQTCAGLWLRRELQDLPNLKAIIPLGAESTKFLLGDHGASPGKLLAYAEKIEVGGRQFHVLPIAHPAYFLRSSSKKFQLYNSLLPTLREYLRRELPETYERSAKRP